MTPPSRPRRRACLVLGVAVLLAGGVAWSQQPPPAPVAAPASALTPKPAPVAGASQPARPLAAASTRQAAKASQPRPAQSTRTVEATPTWNELTPAQKKALEPLATSWSRLGQAHKRKWLAVSSNFPNMPAGEQARLHSRMAEWAALSPQQRTQARLNFAETQALPVDDKRAKWEAYQALSPEEKKKLAAGAGKPVPPTAAAVKPVPPQKLATMPKPRKNDAPAPRIAVAPEKIDHNTLLPQPGTLPPSQP